MTKRRGEDTRALPQGPTANFGMHWPPTGAKDLAAAGVYRSEQMNTLAMKRHLLWLLTGTLWLPSGLAAQARMAQPVGAFVMIDSQPAATNLTRFDLDFPGGSPEQLVRAIEKASGRPLNAILPKGAEEVELPPLRMKGVTTPTLFEALKMASQRLVYIRTGTYDYGGLYGGSRAQWSQKQVSCGFETLGTLTDDSVWYFVYDNPAPPPGEAPRTYRFYQLAPYLETYKVEDITTAIQTGYKMLGEKSPPTISFHKDTKLLIAVGDADKLQLIDDVLKQLSGGPKSGKESPSPPKTPTPTPGQPTKTE